MCLQAAQQRVRSRRELQRARASEARFGANFVTRSNAIYSKVKASEAQQVMTSIERYPIRGVWGYCSKYPFV